MDADLRAYLERIDSRLDESDRRFEAAAARLDFRLDETRRHFDVIAEGMRAEVRLVAEGVTALAERVDRVENNLREEIRQTRADLTAVITTSYRDLDGRLRRLESPR